ncbi:class I SAM-dependent methyltransferase [Chloroflexota bacterium]
MFGHPYKELQDYFNSYPVRGSVLDLGCGQGRDALFLASLGYAVTAVDSSSIGIEQMLSEAERRGLRLSGIVADVLKLKLQDKFDIVLFDMLLHSFKKEQQSEILMNYSVTLNKKGLFCIIYPDDMSTDHFMNILASLPCQWKLLNEGTIKDVPKIEGEPSDFSFTMMVAQITS